MTTERTYRCNLCREQISEKTGVGIFFSVNHRIDVKQPLSSVEQHICRKCVAGVAAFPRAVYENIAAHTESTICTVDT